MGAADKSVPERRRTPRQGDDGEWASFVRLFQAGPQYRIELIREGVAAREVAELSALLAVSKESLMDALGIPRATLNRKVRENRPLPPDESERVLGVKALIGQVQTMVEQSGNAEGFDTLAWLSRWLNTSVPALGGKTPASYLDTVEGQKYIANLLDMTQSGAYA
jgi:putative toxin-antitoxin system antitoxin component (TIGR02293 family)